MFTLICGLPRSGKTTYSKRFDNVIHLDTDGGYPGVAHLLKRKKQYNSDEDIILEGVYNTIERRKRIMQIYKGDYFKCIWINTPKQIRQKREGYDKYCDFLFEPPSFEEGWNEIIIIENNKERILNKEE